MIEFCIASLDLEEISKSSFFRVDYVIKSEKTEDFNLKFSIYDPFFDVQYTPGELLVSSSSNGTIYWVGFEVDKTSNEEKPNFKFGFRLVVEETGSGDILHDEKHWYYPKEWKDRILNENGGKKICWIIGDSHAWECFGGYEHRPLFMGDYFPVRISITSLSLNRFIRGEYISFLNSLPIGEKDALVFILAGSDFNYTIHKHCLDKKESLPSVCLKLMEDYYLCIQKIKREMGNRIVVMSPLPPMRDGFLKKYILGSEEDRIFCWKFFDEFCKSRQDEIEYLDWTEKYKLGDGMVNTNLMMDSDHHIRDYYHCISELSYKLTERMKVIVKLQGGLANQMFQYSFGKFISNKTGRELILDLSSLKNREIPETDYFVYRNYDLDVFDIDPKIVDSFEEEYELIQEPWNDFFTFKTDLVERALLSNSHNIYLDGYWNSFRYFTDEISSQFILKGDILDESRDLMEEILRTDSVMIHVRRTDFLTNPLLLTIGEEYINAAVKELGEKNKKFFIFSDDPQWCSDNLSHLGTIVGKEHNGFKNSNCFRLMSSCKNFIISNSTFGWWSAYLSKKSLGVIYPTKVFKEGYQEVPKDWNPLGWKGIYF